MLRLVRCRVLAQQPSGGAARRLVRPALLRGLIIFAAGALLCTPAAHGAPSPPATQSATATLTIPVKVKSVTLSTTQLTLASCASSPSVPATMNFPNDKCSTGALTITNGQVPSLLMVSGTNAIPSDRGKAWTLCNGGTSCANSIRTPGKDLFSEGLSAPGGLGFERGFIGASPVCGGYFNQVPCGSAGPGQSWIEQINIYGPSQSTDPSPRFTTQVTFTAS
jgi:hypothetical protein